MLITKKQTIQKKFLGGLLSFTKDVIGIGGSIKQGFDDERQRKRSNSEFDRQFKLQDDALRHGIKIRTDDAKASGIHPLYALGASTHSPAPVHVSGRTQSRAQEHGQNIGNAVGRMIDPSAKKGLQLQHQLMAAQAGKDDAIRMYYEALAKKTETDSAGGIGPTRPNIVDEVFGKKVPKGNVTIGELQEVAPDFGAGLTEIVPSKQKTAKHGRPGIMTGQNPAYQEFILPGGQPIQLPASEEGSLSEVLEAIPYLAWPGIIAYNQKQYGSPWAKDFRDFFIFGDTTKNYYPRAKNRKKNQFYKQRR